MASAAFVDSSNSPISFSLSGMPDTYSISAAVGTSSRPMRRRL